MAIKDILAVVDTGDKDERFLRDALAFAEFHDASLAIVVLSALPASDYALTVALPYVLLPDYTEAVEAKPASASACRIRSRLPASGIPAIQIVSPSKDTSNAFGNVARAA